jgi:molybdopterin/thiamine biosynthesis adenylyltransferase
MNPRDFPERSFVFNYAEFTGRNIGFVSPEDQAKISQAKIFIPGVGGMGGSALESLVRLGVQNFIIADFDSFEISNMNRQVMSSLETVGVPKVEATLKRIRSINPNIQVKIYGREWSDKLDEILPQVDFALNGCDDTKATITLMRKGHEHRKTVIDAFASPLPSVYVVHPAAERPEKMMLYPSVGKALNEIDSALEKRCQVREVAYVMTHSSSAKHVIWEYAMEVVEGKRKRFSLSPMVTMTGNLMAYEALKIIIGEKSVVTERGVFYNPWRARVEHPLPWWLCQIRGFLIRRFLEK